jgi:hypothetical protein
MKKTNRKPLQLNTETLRLLQGHELATVAGAVGGGDAPEAFPTNGCRTLIGSFNGNCCNTKIV